MGLIMVYPLCIIGVIALDQLSKLIVVNRLSLSRSVPLIDGILKITLARNPGGAFGILQSKGSLVMIVTAAISIGLLGILLFMDLRNGYIKLGLAIIAGGALGNLIDRIRLGYVVDFLDLGVWPVFNLADVAIVAGTGVIILSLIRRVTP